MPGAYSPEPWDPHPYQHSTDWLELLHPKSDVKPSWEPKNINKKMTKGTLCMTISPLGAVWNQGGALWLQRAWTPTWQQSTGLTSGPSETPATTMPSSLQRKHCLHKWKLAETSECPCGSPNQTMQHMWRTAAWDLSAQTGTSSCVTDTQKPG